MRHFGARQIQESAFHWLEETSKELGIEGLRSLRRNMQCNHIRKIEPKHAHIASVLQLIREVINRIRQDAPQE
eukprot:CAMPEP_0203990750 /NCGR_PEP_ID=MMETSP0360-20130528/9052_1 /ASSEMBLY_ACC=CAM_ASM_000342 /TAXON_ID=268821 /ORGANISM="Scrippsiella Hangoei, Strain SHTV-5" /LENGTH=72 /DNA_ID=CAMNT_0050930875 /DNA_START=20 /DNA_END=235 /DNA_ORIENTATION=-